MSKRHMFFFLCLISATFIHAQEPEVIVPDNDATPKEVQAAPEEMAPKPKPNALSAFTRFVRIFVALIYNPQIKENIQLIEKLFVSLLQTAHQVAQTTKPAELKQTRSEQCKLLEELAHTIVSESESLEIQRACTHQKHSGMDEQTKAILLNFAAVVQNFFNILQDPENKDNVAPNVMGMVAGMMNIGTIAATKGNVAFDASTDQLKAYVRNLDIETKQSMHRIIFTAQERYRIALDL